MQLTEAITHLFNGNQFVIERNVEGLSHGESLLNPRPDGNNLNWVLGHVLSGRVEAYEHLGLESFWDEDTRGRYRTGSEAITAETALPLAELLALLATSQKGLVAGLAAAGEEHLARPYNEQITIGRRLLGLAWHETYHAGQTDYLRRLAGKLEGGVR